MLVNSYTSTVKVGNTSQTTSYSYTYDVDGNITQIVDGNGKKISYVYDDLGQLTRENIQVLEKVSQKVSRTIEEPICQTERTA